MPLLRCSISLRHGKRAVLKPNKDDHHATSYRPISQLPYMSKVVERIILRLLKTQMDVKRIVPDEQFGFREGHGTNLQAARVVDATNAFNKRNYTAAVTLDVEKALRRHDFPPCLIHLLRDYLKGRNFRVKVNDAKSRPIEVTAGVLQGSVLGPILYTYTVYTIVYK